MRFTATALSGVLALMCLASPSLAQRTTVEDSAPRDNASSQPEATEINYNTTRSSKASGIARSDVCDVDQDTESEAGTDAGDNAEPVTPADADDAAREGDGPAASACGTEPTKYKDKYIIEKRKK